MALIVAPEAPLEPWLAALDEQMRRSAGFFADRPIIANLAAINDGSQIWARCSMRWLRGI